MATVTSLGAGSGLDLESLVTSLMKVEQTPLTRLQNKASSYNSTLSALGVLKAKLASLQTASNALKPTTGQAALENFATYASSVADTTIASTKASTGAVAGTYSLSVSTLAVASQFKSSAGLTPSVGSTLSFSFATDGTTRNKTITIDSTNNSLTGLRDAINKAAMGVSATVVNGTGGAQLVLAGESGVSNEITLGGSLAASMTRSATAGDAAFVLNGIAVQSAKNTTSSAIDGVEITLNKIGTTTLSVDKDTNTKLASALTSFVDAYNSASSLMKTQGAYDPSTKVAGVLQGNSTLRSAQSELRNSIYSISAGGSSAYQRLSDIGISVSTTGTMTLDTTKLRSAVAADGNGVATLVAKIGSTFSSKLTNIVGTSGSIEASTTGLSALIKANSEQQTTLGTRLTTIEAQYRKRFASLDTLISGMNSTSSYLTQQIAQLQNN